MSAIEELIAKFLPGGMSREPTFDSSTLNIMETEVKDARVFNGTLQVRVYDPKTGDLLGPEVYTQDSKGSDRYEKGYWIPWIFPLSVCMAFTGPIWPGQRVLLLFPKGNPQAGIAIPVQMRGEIQDASAVELATVGPNQALANWDGGNSWI